MSCQNYLCSFHCLQSAKKLVTGRSGGKRRSIKESEFAAEYAVMLKPVYKYYQAMQFATHGYRFQWDTAHRQDCIQMLLDAARECHTRDDYTRFKRAVRAELVGQHSTPRY